MLRRRMPPPDALITLAVVAAIVFALARNLASPDLVFMAGLALLLVTGVVTPSVAFSGFSNPGVLTVAAFFVVAAGIRATGVLDIVARRLLGAPKRFAAAQLRMMLPVAGLSAFLGNTAVVAMGIPLVLDQARRLGRSPSRLLIPLSYAAILGGACTLVGSSVNLVILGLLQAYDPDATIGMFDVAVVGVPALAVGILYVLVASRWLLPDRGEPEALPDNPREYSVMMRVEAGSPVVGQTVEAAGLRHLPGLFLSAIERHDVTLPAVGPETILEADDRLVFVGLVESVADLRRIPGLVSAERQVHRLDDVRPERSLVEAVVAATSPLSGRSIRDSSFRTAYGAAVIAVRRHGRRLHAKLGDIVLEAGDTLLLEAPPGFAAAFGKDDAFLLIREVEGSRAPRRHKAGIAVGILAAMVIVAALGWLPLVTAALLAAGAMVVARCINGREARTAVDLRVVVAIAAAFGVGGALEQTGLADLGAGWMVAGAAPLGPVALLAAAYLVAALCTEVMTNAAAAALVFPLVAAAAEAAGLPLMPFVFVLMIAVSASFSTPVGYQTNLMVYGPGGYRFGDFVRFGLPLQVLVAAVTLLVASRVWI
jgi:di/tricarboxylate transporter